MSAELADLGVAGSVAGSIALEQGRVHGKKDAIRPVPGYLHAPRILSDGSSSSAARMKMECWVAFRDLLHGKSSVRQFPFTMIAEADFLGL